MDRKDGKVLIIDVCRERLHAFEFVRPVENAVRSAGFGCTVRHYRSLTERDVSRFSKIIICGTSLKDNQFAEDIGMFSWLKKTDRPVLGICAGMQIMGMVFGSPALKKKTEIGFYRERFGSEFLGIKGECEVYHLHNNYADFSNVPDFEICCESGRVHQAVRHRKKRIFGMLFHPEVRNREMIANFCGL